jgi:hypothetical protein
MSVVEQTPLELAEREHADALDAWRDLARREDEIRRGNVLTRVDGRVKERKLDEIERVAELARLAGERAPLAERLLAARDRLREAKAAEVNRQLPRLVEAWQEKSAAAQESRAVLERALARLLIATMGYEVARQEEERTARACLRATEPALDDDGREGLRLGFEHGIPVAVTAEGVELIDRPGPELFGGASDPRDAATWSGIAAGMSNPDRIRAAISGTKLGELVDEIEQSLEAR